MNEILNAIFFVIVIIVLVWLWYILIGLITTYTRAKRGESNIWKYMYRVI